jgi:hypothetical protein
MDLASSSVGSFPVYWEDICMRFPDIAEVVELGFNSPTTFKLVNVADPNAPTILKEFVATKEVFPPRPDILQTIVRPAEWETGSVTYLDGR